MYFHWCHVLITGITISRIPKDIFFKEKQYINTFLYWNVYIYNKTISYSHSISITRTLDVTTDHLCHGGLVTWLPPKHYRHRQELYHLSTFTRIQIAKKSTRRKLMHTMAWETNNNNVPFQKLTQTINVPFHKSLPNQHGHWCLTNTKNTGTKRVE